VVAEVVDIAERARRAASLYVTAVDEGPPADVLVDIGPLSAREILSAYEARQAKYATTPFDPDGNILRLYPGGVTIWSGFPGAGKTTLLRQFICHLLSKGKSVFLASLEEDPQDVLLRLAATAAGVSHPTPDQLQWFIDAYCAKLRLWGVIGIAKHADILACIRKLDGVDHAVIDSLMCLDITNDDFEGQRKFANLLAATARQTGKHLHLVAHPRKLVSANQPLDLNDVAGAREIGGIADNVLFVRRGAEAQEYGPTADPTPMCVSIRKQRHFNGVIADVEGWFHRRWRQFNKDETPMHAVPYLPMEAYQ